MLIVATVVLVVSRPYLRNRSPFFNAIQSLVGVLRSVSAVGIVCLRVVNPGGIVARSM